MVRGALAAVFLGGQDVVETAIQVLAYLPNISLMTTAGASDLMSWVMEGIADVTPVAGPEVRDKLAARIDEKFMGAGEVFAALCAKAK